MPFAIEDRILEAQPAALIRARTTPEAVGAAIGELLPRVGAYLESRQVTPAGAPFVRYVGMGAEMEIEAGIPVATAIEGDDSVQPGQLAGGPAVVAVYTGGYEGLFEAHQAAHKWIAENGMSIAGPPWESYVTDPGAEPDSAKWVTEVVCPVIPA